MDSCVCGLLSTSQEIIPLKCVCITGELVNAFSYISAKFVYENDREEPIEAIFTFSMHEVTVYYFDAVIGDRTIVAECRPKVEAKATYDEAVKSGHTAFVIEGSDRCEDIFQMTIGNIPSKGKVTINLKYVGLMEARNLYNKDGDFTYSEIRFTLPQVLNPRYSPEQTKISDMCELRGIGYSFNPTKYTLEFKLNVDMMHDINSVESVRDKFSVDYSCSSKRSACVTLMNDFQQDHDLHLVIKLGQKLQSMAVVAPGDANKDGVLSKHCLTAQFVPEICKSQSLIEPKNEIIFMVDRSGSMGGNNIRFAQSMLVLLLKSLPVGCSFQIVGFGSTHECLFDRPQEYSEDTLDKAMEYQSKMDADMGGTELFEALSEVFDKFNVDDGRPRQVILLTDGAVGNAYEVIALVHTKSNKARVFAIGLGEGASVTLVSGMARVGGGICAFARHESELHSAAMKVLDAALQGRASNVQVNFELVDKSPQPGSPKTLDVMTIPKNLPVVYNGQILTCYAFFSCADIANLAGKVTLQFEIMGKKHKLVLEAASFIVAKELNSAGSLPLHRLAGKYQIDELMREYHALMLNRYIKDDNEKTPAEKLICGQVEALSINLNLLTKLTSFVGVDTSKSVNPGEREPIVVSMGYGTTYDCGVMPQWGYSNITPYSYMPACASSMPECAVTLRSTACDMDLEWDSSPVDDSPEVGDDNNKDKPKPPMHVQLASLQKYTGCWRLDSSLSDLFGIDLDSLTQHCPKLVVFKVLQLHMHRCNYITSSLSMANKPSLPSPVIPPDIRSPPQQPLF